MVLTLSAVVMTAVTIYYGAVRPILARVGII